MLDGLLGSQDEARIIEPATQHDSPPVYGGAYGGGQEGWYFIITRLLILLNCRKSVLYVCVNIYKKHVKTLT